MTKELNFQEQAFVEAYLSCFNAREAARMAGYADSVADVHAWRWVSMISCPPHKRHVYQAIETEIQKRFGDDMVDKVWILKRAKRLLEFNLGLFIRLRPDGVPVYDFSNATLDDWWCIEEFMTETALKLARAADEDGVEVTKIKVKTPNKTALLKLLGDHVSVQAWKENVEHSGTVTTIQMSPEDYKKARAEMLNEDDC